MGNVQKPTIQWRGAHPNNFTVGRPGGGLDGRNTFHHVVGSAESAVLVFNNANRGASSHLVITDRADVAAFQCVDFANTAWCDANWDSNLRTISMEHHGDWRNGYRDAQVIENSAKIVAWLRDQGLVSRFQRHRDVSRVATECPAQLPVEEIWDRATQIIAAANQPITPPAAEWIRNRQVIPAKTVFAQQDGVFIRNLNDPGQAADSRRFVVNQSFEVTGKTRVGVYEYYITRSSMSTNAANGLAFGEVADNVFVPPTPVPAPVPQPQTPAWADTLLVDDDNREMYVLRATPLIDLENGHPYTKDGKETWYQAGDIIKDVSAHTIVNNNTYSLTEFSFQNVKTGKLAAANGIKSSDLTIDPKATPPGTPANPTPAPTPTDPVEPMPDVPTPPVTPTTPDRDATVAFLQMLGKLIAEFLARFNTKK